MSNFLEFRNAVEANFDDLTIQGKAFRVNITGDELYEAYINSFPNGTNPIFREKTEHECSCCRQFIKSIGNVVIIVDGKLTSIWDVSVDDFYQDVANAMRSLVESSTIKDAFYHFERHAGTDHNHEIIDGVSKRWNHLHAVVPDRFVKQGEAIASALSSKRADKEVFMRGLDEITCEAVDTVLELIDNKSLYKGEENQSKIEAFKRHLTAYSLCSPEQRDLYAWEHSSPSGRIKNSSIGTLLIDISEGMELDQAVRKFEAMVAPANYKRSSAVVSKAMIAKAEAKVIELGLMEALPRRFARTSDISINNVLFADRTVQPAMNAFDQLAAEIPQGPVVHDNTAEVSIEEFITNIMPKASGMEILLDSAHKGNLMSLVAPVNAEAPNMLKWGNNFSWAYNGDVTDSMKERVKAAGGKVDGHMRFSIQWNDEALDSSIDFDAHCAFPGGHVFYSNPRHSATGCNLDVDITRPGTKVAVENITWPDASKIVNGEYHIYVHNFSGRTSAKGFTAEFELDGTIHSYVYDKPLRGHEDVTVAKFIYKADGTIEFIESLDSTESTQEVYGLNTQQFHKVNMVMHSPNHWDGEKTGNKHWFFILDKCVNPERVRGFYNEFLSDALHDDRKVFEMLGARMKTEESDQQLSGLGFSSTRRNQMVVKLSGDKNQIIKVNF